MLESVTNPDGKVVSFEYDALGRRTAKIANQEINRYVWDGNVLIHEWKYDLNQRPQLVVQDDDLLYNKSEPIENLVTWVYEEGSFVPSAKLINGGKFSIINDYIGRPIQAYNELGNLVWETDYDIYGGLRNLKGDRNFIPFRQLGQYEDVESGFYYNRFRYYSPETGMYLSQDPIGIFGNNPNMYAYVKDANNWIDIFGLNNVSTGEGRSHVKYSGIKEGKPYHGYASAPTSDGLTPDEIVSRRYGGNFDDFDIAPTVDYSGEGKTGKQTARGLEQRGFEADGGLKGTSNAQNPVGPNNANRQKYLDAADEHLGTKIKCH